MAFVSSGKLTVDNSSGTCQMLFMVIREFLCSRSGAGGDFTTGGLGYEYYDNNFSTESSPSVGEYFVTRHNSNNSGAYFYLLWEYEATTKCRVAVYLDWNLVTHTPVGGLILYKEFFDLYGQYITDLYIVGDDANDTYVTLIGYNSAYSVWDFSFIGMPQGEFGNVVNTRYISGGASAGSDVVLTLNGTGLPAEFTVGSRVYVAGMLSSALTYEMCEITAIDSGTPSVTVDLVNSYDTNMMIGTSLAWYAYDPRDNGTAGYAGIVSGANTGTLPPAAAVQTGVSIYRGSTNSYSWVTGQYYAEQVLLANPYNPLAIIPNVLMNSGFNTTFAVDEELLTFDSEEYRTFKTSYGTLYVLGA